MKDWRKKKSEIGNTFFPISGDLGELGIPTLAGISLMKFY